MTWAVAGTCIVLGTISWLGIKASEFKAEMDAVAGLIPQLKADFLGDDPLAATTTVDQLKVHTSAARRVTKDPLWIAATAVPWLGANFQAASEVAMSAEDVIGLGVAPLVTTYQSLDWKSLLPSDAGVDLMGMASAGAQLNSTAHALRTSSERLNNIDETGLLPQVSGPLVLAREQLSSATDTLGTVANTANLVPDMMGADSPRRYLLLIQNNAEARTTGGIPGALAVLTVDKGKLSLDKQTSATEMGIFSPGMPVDSEQEQVYTRRLGKYMQDVNLTPDFPTSASTAESMWATRTDEHVDGVISIDPVALSYILEATGPVSLPALDTRPRRVGLPTELTATNVVPTLLSDVYAEIAEPHLQDAYFSLVAQEIFSAVSAGKGGTKDLLDGLIRGVDEHRILLWSAKSDEQSLIALYPVSGSIAGPSVPPAQFGVYFNDGTGAKMDYYVKRTVQLVGSCTGDDYSEVKVKVTSTNVAPLDAASALPAYVTGGGVHGVPAGSVQTNVIAYGPVQANVETAHVNGQKSDFAAQRHANRPVGTVTVTLAPGQSSTVELTFGKIVQHAEPNLVVTPSVQPVKDVVLATENAACN
ncbi:DUF4012 domain-containing protein [Arthrobacter sp. AL12]|uniref:DUF4012 domain-containing protein n=1 Tax=Arthrobacter sp. AL12 TaxID=3042241 RepID=UPI00249CAC98|nr:DUF4012 domain-containing protein [Arthrobacter sp. AL12]MDI3213088.1 DUF4012 domain-containing protein [Arthrobacter sp. AL12]